MDCAAAGATATVDGTDSNSDPVPAGQDALLGRDAIANDDSDGHAGFSFTKLDAAGDPLADQGTDYATTPWSCVRDDVTGLIWEVKTDDGGLHDKDDRYNWYNTDSATNGGSAGYADDDGAVCSGYSAGDSATWCNTEAYVARVNAAGWCGASDWRLPSQEELQSIAHLGRTNPAIDTGYFPNTVASWYWSSSPDASVSTDAWVVGFDFGFGYWFNKNDTYYVRLVRAGQ